MVKVPVPYAEPSQRINIIYFSTAHSPEEYGKLMGLCFISDGKYSCQDLVRWAINHLEGKYLSVYVNWLGGGAVYHLWNLRNPIIHAGIIKTDGQVIRDIKKDVRARVERAKSGRKILYLIIFMLHPGYQ